MTAEQCITYEGTQRGYIQGSKVLCLLIDIGQALCFSFVGGVRRRLALSAIAPRLTPPTGFGSAIMF
jgi:hypothetical protein